MTRYITILLSFFLIGQFTVLYAQPVTNEAYYRIETIPIPDDIVLEVGGMAFTEEGKLGIATRRGEIWVVDQLGSSRPGFTRFAQGLHEPLGLGYQDGTFYSVQRAEVTKLIDADGNGEADQYLSLYSWPLSGNYHEYSYGPLFLPNGDMLVTLNLAWVGFGESFTKWRGWLVQISQDGELTPIATGLRSPAGFGFNPEGDVFYAENQGDWIGSGRITHLEVGDFAGNPAGLNWSNEPNSPLSLQRDEIPDSVGLMHEFAKDHPEVKVPAVWFPHTIMGISTSDILSDTTRGKFGPFAGQLFVGDQGHSKIMRVYLEKIQGEYQGACFPFVDGFSSGILRLRWSPKGEMYVGMTSRGWAATGKNPFGLQRLVWTGEMPFEMKAIRAMANGFEIEFTQPVNKTLAAMESNYSINSFIYSYHRKYGSPIINQQNCSIRNISVADDNMSVKIEVDGLREGYIHELKLNGIKSNKGLSLWHNVGYYTLNHFAEGTDAEAQLAASEVTASTQKCEDSDKRRSEKPDQWDKPDIVINIGTQPGLKYDKSTFSVEEGQKVQLNFVNNDDMLHNLVITKPGKVDYVGQEAMQLGLKGSSLGYVPTDDAVLYHTCLLQPETSERMYFIAPKAGEYPYVCTFPGHYELMRGVMEVKPAGTAAR